MPQMYAREDVQSMIDELTNVGVKSLMTAEDVDSAVVNTEGVTMVVVNSVCGCAAGNCRPGVTLALQNEKIPDTLTTVFAGAMDRSKRCSLPSTAWSRPDSTSWCKRCSPRATRMS